MPSTYTNSLRLVLPATGELSNTWGTVFNAGATSLIDTSIAGTATITMTAADYTLSNNNGATDESRAMFLVLSGTPGASYNVICPAVSKLYFVTNNTGFAQTVKTSAGTGISVPNGASMTLRCDGTNVVSTLNYFGSLTLGSALAVGSGGTGATTLTGVVIGNGTSAFTSKTNPTGAFIGDTDTQTLTNKTITPRVVSIADATSVTINADTTDIATQANTQAVGTLTINAPTGTPVNGQKIIFRLQSTNVQTFSWNAIFAGSTDLSLPTASTGTSKYDYMGFIYNSTATKWQILAKNFGF